MESPVTHSAISSFPAWNATLRERKDLQKVRDVRLPVAAYRENKKGTQLDV